MYCTPVSCGPPWPVVKDYACPFGPLCLSFQQRYAAGNAVVVAGDGDVHQLPPGHRHRRASLRIRGCDVRPYPTAPVAGLQGLCLSFWTFSSSRGLLQDSGVLNVRFLRPPRPVVKDYACPFGSSFGSFCPFGSFGSSSRPVVNDYACPFVCVWVLALWLWLYGFGFGFMANKWRPRKSSTRAMTS